ncbi:MAG: hypothetical protein KBS56_02050 [Clostridiales bacterium]|nr:hypothetical protein [Candidatus Crickella equi]
MLLYERAKARLEYIDERTKKVKKEIHNLPAGRLECIKRDRGYRWFIVKNGERTILKKRERPLAQRLAYKRKLNDELDNLACERTALDIYVKIMSALGVGESVDINELVSTSNAKCKKVRIKDLVRPNQNSKRNEEVDCLAREYMDQKHPEVSRWEKAAYEHKSDDDKKHNVRANSGRYHESKDEVLIDNALLAHGLKVRYEPLLNIEANSLHPDFCILNPRTGEEVYWEHFGMMERPDYYSDAIWKMKLYLRNGYYPGVNFIATYSGGKYRLDSQLVESIIEYFFE